MSASHRSTHSRHSAPRAHGCGGACRPSSRSPHAELAALRDEVRRLRDAQANALEIIDEQAPALTLEELVKRWAAAQYPPPGGATTEWVRGALELHYELMRRAGYERPQPSKQED